MTHLFSHIYRWASMEHYRSLDNPPSITFSWVSYLLLMHPTKHHVSLMVLPIPYYPPLGINVYMTLVGSSHVLAWVQSKAGDVLIKQNIKWRMRIVSSLLQLHHIIFYWYSDHKLLFVLKFILLTFNMFSGLLKCWNLMFCLLQWFVTIKSSPLRLDRQCIGVQIRYQPGSYNMSGKSDW